MSTIINFVYTLFGLARNHNAKILLVIVLYIFVPRAVSLGNTKLYFINNNEIGQLIEDRNFQIPVLKGGVTYRILEVIISPNEVIKKVESAPNLEMYFLPVIKNVSNKDILDVLIPASKKEVLCAACNFILLKINGHKTGEDKVTIKVATNKRTIRKEITTVTPGRQQLIAPSLNVWSYLNSNFLVENVSQQVVDDLVNHRVNTIIIPPNVLPEVNSITKQRINTLSNYLKHISGKFENYIIYFGGWHDRPDHMMSPVWQKSFPHWVNVLASIFEAQGIAFERVIFYPYDEPLGKSVLKLNEIIRLAKNLKLDNKFYVTLSNRGTGHLAEIVDIVQVHSGVPGLIEEVLEYSNHSTAFWLYETNFGRSNTNKPDKYVKLGIKASMYDFTGIGIWSYADVKRENLKSFQRGEPSWNLGVVKSNERDNTVIYRKGNQIYSSLRWEGLVYALEEIKWLELYGVVHGQTQKKVLATKILDGKIQLAEWEQIKVSLIN